MVRVFSSVVAGILVLAGPRLFAYDPESPEVVAMVERAMIGLATQEAQEAGGQPLIALPYVKDGQPDHPQVKKALQFVHHLVSSGPNTTEMRGPMYSRAVSLIFLCELDPVAYKSEIEFLIERFYERQMPGGGWGYATFVTGDTSQSQYGILALWTAKMAGFQVDMERAERAMNWFMRTQDLGGGFCYQPNDATGRQKQAQVKLGLSAAGTASLYVAADLCGLGAGDKKRSREEDIPPALRLISDESDEQQPGGKGAIARNVNKEALRRAQAEGNRFFDSIYSITPGEWQSYYLYTLERYMSFRESFEGGAINSKWYDEGVELLMKSQRTDGTWLIDAGGVGAGGDTAFAIMFLTRSTKKKIAKAMAGDGILAGGKGLNGDVSKAKQRDDGKIVAVPKSNSVDDLLNALEDPNNSDIEGIADTGEALKLDFKDPKKFEAQVIRLRRLVTAQKYEVRIVAVRTLGRTDDFDNVPYLIYAHTDPDIRVVRAADAGLRHITRRLDGVGMPNEPTDPQKFAAVQAWKQWYRSVNPSAIFLE